MRTATTVLITALSGLALAGPVACAPERTPDEIALVTVARGLDHPVWLTAPAGDPRIFVVEQPGRIRILSSGRLLERPFLDIVDRVRSGGEQGLLSVAFHPRYRENGLLFVNYTDRRGDTRIERYRVSADPDRADPASATLVLHVAQPYANHNGGLNLFGPDGMLWIGMGDGGSGGDPHGNGQNPRTLLGKMLRIDVDHGTPYAIPRDNPFADGARGLPEIWALGLRNPWRFGFDPAGRTLIIADVGQNRWEEIDAVPAATPALNYGWNAMEGRHAFSGSASPAGSVVPVHEYGHRDGCSVIGGFVYRGSTVPALRGQYVFSDYCRGWIRSLRLDGRSDAPMRRWRVRSPGAVTSFGEDSRGELYVLTQEGSVLRLDSPGRTAP